jgi:hypothetical protein
MRRRLWCGLLYLLLAGTYVRAAEPGVITLSCDGTVKANIGSNEGERKPINKVELRVENARSRSQAMSLTSKTSTA